MKLNGDLRLPDFFNASFALSSSKPISSKFSKSVRAMSDVTLVSGVRRLQGLNQEASKGLLSLLKDIFRDRPNHALKAEIECFHSYPIMK